MRSSTDEELRDATLAELCEAILADLVIGSGGIIRVRGQGWCYIPGAELSHEEAAAIAAELGIDLQHDCDQRAQECSCANREISPALDPDGFFAHHAPGDERCVGRHQHAACSHDLRRLADHA